MVSMVSDDRDQYTRLSLESSVVLPNNPRLPLVRMTSTKPSPDRLPVLRIVVVNRASEDRL